MTLSLAARASGRSAIELGSTRPQYGGYFIYLYLCSGVYPSHIFSFPGD